MAQAKIAEVYYFHTDQAGLPEELSNSQGQLVWQATYKTWGNTRAEEWKLVEADGSKTHPLDAGDQPENEAKQQNLRFQGQYLDRDTGLHYNTFRYYDPDIGRFISPDPIGLEGGINLGSYSPNPISWIDPWGWSCGNATGAKRGPKTDPNAPHNAKIREVAAKLEDEGNTIIAGGGGKEKAIPTPGGHKGSRRADILYETPDKQIKAVNVGRTKADGSPVTREVKAMQDLIEKAGIPTIFVPYDR